MDAGRRWKIFYAYCEVLEGGRYTAGDESQLPFPKGVIRMAIAQELLEQSDAETRNVLEGVFMTLGSFIPPDEFAVVKEYEDGTFRPTGVTPQEALAELEEISKQTEQGDREALARYVEAHREEIERSLALPIDRYSEIVAAISERTKESLEQLRVLRAIWEGSILGLPLLCPNCSSPIREGVSFCSNCGCSLA